MKETNKKQWQKRSRKGDPSSLDTWNGRRGKDYQSQIYMDMTVEGREAEGGKGRSGWTTSGKA